MGDFYTWNLDDNIQKYKECLEKCEEITPYHKVEYLLAEEKAEKYPIRIFAYEEGKNCAVCAGVVRKINDLPFVDNMNFDVYDMISPHEYSGIVASSCEIIPILLVYLEKYCVQQKIVSSFIRINPFLSYLPKALEAAGYDVILSAKQVVVNLRYLEEEIRKSYKNNVRRNLKRAENEKLKFVIAEKNQNNMELFITMYQKAMMVLKAKKFLYFNEQYFNYLFRCGFSRLCFVKDNYDTAIAASIMLLSSKTVYYHLGCFDRDYILSRPMDFLMHSMIFWCKENGYEVLHLGGGSESLLHFKKKFSGDGLEYYTARKVLDDRIYMQLCDQWRKYYNCYETKYEGHFPLYRANED